MKSAKNYSKKKSRVQQKVKSKVKSKVQPKVQARIQARSNKKQINKRVNKNIIRGTKKVQRNKNKKVTKKNLNSRVNVSGGGGRLQRFGNFVLRRTVEKPVLTIFFDVDGTLGDTGCGGIMKPYEPRKREVLLTLLDDLKKQGVKLFILTRCGSRGNICNGEKILPSLEIRQCDYYEEIVEKMDGVFAADILNINVNDPSDTDKTERGGSAWATIKSMVMEKYCKNILEKQRARVILIDDDSLNATRASEFGFRAFHNSKKRNPGAALKMTNNALIEILDEIDPETSHRRTYLKDKDKDKIKEAVTPQKNEAKIKDYKTQLGNLKKYADQDQDQLVQQSKVEKFINKTVQRVLKGEKVQCKKKPLEEGTHYQFNLSLSDGNYIEIDSVERLLVFKDGLQAETKLNEYIDGLEKISDETYDNSVIRGAFALYFGGNNRINIKCKYKYQHFIKYQLNVTEILDKIPDNEFQIKMQKILKNPRVKNKIFNIIKDLKVKHGTIVFLPNSPDDSPDELNGFGATGANVNKPTVPPGANVFPGFGNNENNGTPENNGTSVNPETPVTSGNNGTPGTPGNNGFGFKGLNKPGEEDV